MEFHSRHHSRLQNTIHTFTLRSLVYNVLNHILHRWQHLFVFCFIHKYSFVAPFSFALLTLILCKCLRNGDSDRTELLYNIQGTEAVNS